MVHCIIGISNKMADKSKMAAIISIQYYKRLVNTVCVLVPYIFNCFDIGGFNFHRINDFHYNIDVN